MKIDDKNIFVSIVGEGQPVIMVHGLGGTTSVWSSIVCCLKDKYKTISLDIEGAGYSSLSSSQLSVDSMVDDLRKIMDSLELENAHLIGHSFGTVVCQKFAAEHQERVKSLIMLGGIHEFSAATQKALKERANKVRRDGMLEVAQAVAQAGTSEETKLTRPEIIGFTEELLMRQDPEAYARMCEAAADCKPVDLSQIKCPVLLITGDCDIVAPPTVSKEMSKNLTHSKVVIIPGVGHQTTLEKPEFVRKAIIEFLDA